MSVWQRPFSVVQGEGRYFVVAEVSEKTAKRAARLLAHEDGESMAGAIDGAINLHAMPMLIREAK